MKLFILPLLTTLFGSAAIARSLPPDSTANPAVAYATALYQQARANQTNLYNGIEQIRSYPPTTQGHPYYGEDEWAQGTITFDGITYRNVPLRFDLVTDRLVVQHPDSAYRLALVPEKTQEFTLDKQTFIYLREADAARFGLAQGFYHLLHNGKTQLLARRKKELRTELTRNTANYWFEDVNQYFLRLKGTYYPIKNKKSVLELADTQKKSLIKYWRDKKIRFRKNRETALLEAARYFDTLNP